MKRILCILTAIIVMLLQVPGSALAADMPVLTAEAVYGTPIIDGEVDDIWLQCKPFETARKSGTGESESTAVLRALWDDKNLYLLAIVNEKTHDVSSVFSWEQDALEFYVDELNDKASEYKQHHHSYRVNMENFVSAGEGVDVSVISSSACYIEGGYMLEVKIPFLSIKPKADMTIGFEVHVNDAVEGSRIGIFGWNDHQDLAYMNPSVFGNLVLAQETSLSVPESINVVKIDGSNLLTQELEEGQTDKIDETVVSLNFGTNRQIMYALSGNYARGRMAESSSGTSVQDELGEYNMVHLRAPIVRVGIPIIDWAPVEISKSDKINMNEFSDAGYVNSNFKLVKEFSDDGVAIIGTVWCAPDWMVSNPTKEAQRIIKDDMYDSFAKSIAAYVIHAKQKYDADIQYLSVNEADWGAFVKLTADEYAKLAILTGRILEENGIADVKWIVGDTTDAKAFPEYAVSILENEEAQPYLGPLGFHSWDVNARSPQILEKVYEMAVKYNKQAWALECGSDNAAWQRADFDLSSYDTAQKLALNYIKTIKYTGASAMFYWEYQKDYMILSDSLVPYPTFHLLKMLRDYLPEGMQMISVTENNKDVMSIAGYDEDMFTFAIINNSNDSGRLKIENLPEGTFSSYVLQEGKIIQKDKDYTPVSGLTTADMPAKSLLLLTGKPTSIPKGTVKKDEPVEQTKQTEQTVATEMAVPVGDDNILVVINGNVLETNVKPFMKNNRVFVPLRAVFESLGAEVLWEDDTQTVTAKKGSAYVEFSIGDTVALVNGEMRLMDSPSFLLNSSTMVPIRFISEALGARVDWIEQNTVVIINY